MGKVKELIDMFEMTNLRSLETGLPMIIWVRPKGNEKHGPRIKVQRDKSQSAKPDNFTTVTISDTPQIIGGPLSTSDFEKVENFILLNKVNLLRLWNDEISPMEFGKHIKKV